MRCRNREVVYNLPPFIMFGSKAYARHVYKGGVWNGPRILPASHSFWSAASITSGCRDAEAKLVAEWANWGPRYPILQPCCRSLISYLTKVLSWWLLNSHSGTNGCKGIHGSDLVHAPIVGACTVRMVTTAAFALVQVPTRCSGACGSPCIPGFYGSCWWLVWQLVAVS